MLNNFINSDCVIYDLTAKNKNQVFDKLSDKFVSSNVILDKEKFIKAVNYREKIDTTGVGNGIAIPHGKSDTVQKSAVAIAKLKQGINWNSLDGKPVEYVFLLAIPKDGDKEHLKLLSEIAEKLMDDDIIKGLHDSHNKNEIIKLFTK